jgi:hypothetical protein
MNVIANFTSVAPVRTVGSASQTVTDQGPIAGLRIYRGRGRQREHGGVPSFMFAVEAWTGALELRHTGVPHPFSRFCITTQLARSLHPLLIYRSFQPLRTRSGSIDPCD